MSREKKIYADQDPNWEGKDLKYWKLGFPRWWNPVFWLTVIMFPIIAGGYGFIQHTYALIMEIKRFFHNYKIWPKAFKNGLRLTKYLTVK